MTAKARKSREPYSMRSGFLDLELALHQVAGSVSVMHIDDAEHSDLTVFGFELFGQDRGIRFPAIRDARMELGLCKDQVGMRLKGVANPSVGRAGRPEEDNFGGRFHLAGTECKRMTGVSHLRYFEPENVGMRKPS